MDEVDVLLTSRTKKTEMTKKAAITASTEKSNEQENGIVSRQPVESQPSFGARSLATAVPSLRHGFNTKGWGENGVSLDPSATSMDVDNSNHKNNNSNGISNCNNGNSTMQDRYSNNHTVADTTETHSNNNLPIPAAMSMSLKSFGFGIDNNLNSSNDATEAARKAIIDAMERSYCNFESFRDHSLQITIQLGVPATKVTASSSYDTNKHQTNEQKQPKTMDVDLSLLRSVLPRVVPTPIIETVVGGLFVPGDNTREPSICTAVACITLQSRPQPARYQSGPTCSSLPLKSTKMLTGLAQHKSNELPTNHQLAQKQQQRQEISSRVASLSAAASLISEEQSGHILSINSTDMYQHGYQHRQLESEYNHKEDHHIGSKKSLEMLAMISERESNHRTSTGVGVGKIPWQLSATMSASMSNSSNPVSFGIAPSVPNKCDDNTKIGNTNMESNDSNTEAEGNISNCAGNEVLGDTTGHQKEVIQQGLDESRQRKTQFQKPLLVEAQHYSSLSGKEKLQQLRKNQINQINTSKAKIQNSIKHDTVSRVAIVSYRDYANEQPQPEERDCWALSTRSTSSPVFPLKLHETLTQIEKDGYDDIIGFLPHGRSFKIHKQKEFTDIILPRYFVMTKKSSFLRQLNLYSFNRFSGSSPDKGSYYHEKFLRGRKFLSRRMTRQKVNGNRIRSAGNPDVEPDLARYSICREDDFPIHDMNCSSVPSKSSLSSSSSQAVLHT